MNPLISIILPTYNGSEKIARAISSVIAQSYSNWELLVISDGSVDNTASLVESFSAHDPRIIFVANERNLGIQKTLNKGVAMSKGIYIARIDDDDEWVEPTKLAAQIDFLEKNPGYVLVGTDAIVADENGNRLSVNVMPKTDEKIRSVFLSKNCFSHSTILVKKDVLIAAGGYSEKKENLHVEDYDLWMSVGIRGKMKNLEMKSSLLMNHSRSITSQNRILQARHAVNVVLVHKKQYPHFIKGYISSIARLLAFYFFSIVPIPRSLWFKIQRMYRSV
jgi:glycosyltransferase involved in cell wall biosynthesis